MHSLQQQALAVVLLSALALPALATQQIPDTLEYRGQVHRIGDIGNFPLEAYLESVPRDVRHAFRAIRFADQASQRAGGPQANRVSWPSTGCHRGYVAAWTIETNTLYLTAIRFDPGTNQLSVAALAPIFGDKIREGRLQAFWFDRHIALGSELLFFEKGRLVRTQAFEDQVEKAQADDALIRQYNRHRWETPSPASAPPSPSPAPREGAHGGAPRRQHPDSGSPPAADSHRPHRTPTIPMTTLSAIAKALNRPACCAA